MIRTWALVAASLFVAARDCALPDASEESSDDSTRSGAGARRRRRRDRQQNPSQFAPPPPVLQPNPYPAQPPPAQPYPAQPPPAQLAPGAGARRLPLRDPDELREVNATLDRIASGGPFPFRQDGVVFQNREARLPARERGYYHEYTVITPGLTHRGARRIVTGAFPETYYSNDHYGSFTPIDPRRY